MKCYTEGSYHYAVAWCGVIKARYVVTMSKALVCALSAQLYMKLN